VHEKQGFGIFIMVAFILKGGSLMDWLDNMKASDFTKYNRIAIVGCPGCGKSWLSTRIARITGYPLTHLDNEFWQPGWVETPEEEWVLKQRGMITGDKWIIEGNYASTLELRFSAADLVVFIDINRATCIWRAIRRTGKKRSDLPDYLQEPSFFSRDFFDFCVWIWSFPNTGRKAIMILHEKYPEIRFLHIKGRNGVKKLFTD